MQQDGEYQTQKAQLTSREGHQKPDDGVKKSDFPSIVQSGCRAREQPFSLKKARDPDCDHGGKDDEMAAMAPNLHQEVPGESQSA